jgi:hypothetical protein
MVMTTIAMALRMRETLAVESPVKQDFLEFVPMALRSAGMERFCVFQIRNLQKRSATDWITIATGRQMRAIREEDFTVIRDSPVYVPTEPRSVRRVSSFASWIHDLRKRFVME